MTPDDVKARTKQFAVRAFRVSQALPRGTTGDVLGRQLLRAATAVAANYRAACRARSKAGFIAKLGIVEEEADESLFWLELIDELKLIPSSRLRPLLDEANQLVSIVVSSIRTVKRSGTNPKSAIRDPKSHD
ncbi:MAG: four helix bundle protein [Phycisphaeraceae bacterium]